MQNSMYRQDTLICPKYTFITIHFFLSLCLLFPLAELSLTASGIKVFPNPQKSTCYSTSLKAFLLLP